MESVHDVLAGDLGLQYYPVLHLNLGENVTLVCLLEVLDFVDVRG